MSVDFLESLVDRTDNVVALHTEDPEQTLVQFRVMCRRSGKSVYHWSDQHGLISMKAADISVPGSRKLADALRYVMQSMHYGVYVFTGFEAQLQHSCIEYLRGISQSRDGYQRKVVLVGQKVMLPGMLSDHVFHVVEQQPEKLRPRLRDGRWVVA